MPKNIKAIVLGDAMIPCEGFRQAWREHLAPDFGEDIYAGDWEVDWVKLQHRRLEVEKNGPEMEPCEPLVLQYGSDAQILMGLFIAVSSKVMDAMPKLRIVGVSRAGTENVNVAEATKRGILVFNVMGRNAHAVSDFAIGMMLAEARNIARAHYAIKSGQWRKTFVNNGYIPELHGKTIGLVGFGYIGHLVAKKLSGFDVNLLVYDPYAKKEDVEASGGRLVALETLFQQADFVSLHARLTDQNKGMIDAQLLSQMKPTAYFINTSRAGLVDQGALAQALRNHKIMGAAIDVFPTEPIEANNPLLELDNVTLTTHIAGTTADALGNSPFLLAADIAGFLAGKGGKFIVNPEVLADVRLQQWLAELK